MIPPSKEHLQALAGWAIATRGRCSDRQHMALCHFQDGCGELAEVIEDIPQAAVTPKKVALSPSPPMGFLATPREILDLDPKPRKDGDPCSHSFDIRTQLCRYCGLSYRKAMGRKPELM